MINDAPKPCSRILLPPVWFLAALLGMVGLHECVPDWKIVPKPWGLLGVGLMLLGLSVVLAAARQFRRNHTTVKPYESSSVLVTDGVFRWSRNPMYLGLTIFLAGVAIGLRGLTPWILVVAFPLVIDRCFIRAEEHALAARFAEQFADYRMKTRRWL